MSSIKENNSDLTSIEDNLTKKQTVKVKGTLATSCVCPDVSSTPAKIENDYRQHQTNQSFRMKINRIKHLINPNWQQNNSQEPSESPGGNIGIQSIPVQKKDENEKQVIKSNKKKCRPSKKKRLAKPNGQQNDEQQPPLGENGGTKPIVVHKKDENKQQPKPNGQPNNEPQPFELPVGNAGTETILVEKKDENKKEATKSPIKQQDIVKQQPKPNVQQSNKLQQFELPEDNAGIKPTLIQKEDENRKELTKSITNQQNIIKQQPKRITQRNNELLPLNLVWENSATKPPLLHKEDKNRKELTKSIRTRHNIIKKQLKRITQRNNELLPLNLVWENSATKPILVEKKDKNEKEATKSPIKQQDIVKQQPKPNVQQSNKLQPFELPEDNAGIKPTLIQKEDENRKELTKSITNRQNIIKQQPKRITQRNNELLPLNLVWENSATKPILLQMEDKNRKELTKSIEKRQNIIKQQPKPIAQRNNEQQPLEIPWENAGIKPVLVLKEAENRKELTKINKTQQNVTKQQPKPNDQPNNEQQPLELPGVNVGTESVLVKKEHEIGEEPTTNNQIERLENTRSKSISDDFEVKIHKYIRKLYRREQLSFNPSTCCVYTHETLCFSFSHMSFIIRRLLLANNLPLFINSDEPKTKEFSSTANESELSTLKTVDKFSIVHEAEKNDNTKENCALIWPAIHVLFGFIMGLMFIYFFF